MVSGLDLLIVFATSFGFNLIPFAGPSNLFIASTAVLSLGATDPTILVAIGVLIALGGSFAKGIHYMVTFFVSKHLSQKRQERLSTDASKVKKWAFLLLFAAAASPIPDEPIVIPLGLMKYNPAKFFTAFFLGKLIITIAGAFIGAWTKITFSGWLSPEIMIILSITLTVAVTVLLLKVDLGKVFERIIERFHKKQEAHI
jgi:membrane protein YqaA with SNARE-associated domain